MISFRESSLLTTAGSLLGCWYPLQEDFGIQDNPTILNVRPACSESPALLPISRQLLLCILSYRTSFQLDFRQLSMMFSCNFGVVMEGGEHSVYLLCHLDHKLHSVLPSSLFLCCVFEDVCVRDTFWKQN